MDLSALIFVALAVAWAAYLIPKALKQHEEDQRNRTVDSFSSSIRVLASRDSLDGRTARLVVPGRPARGATSVDIALGAPPRSSRAARAARATAARRRRRVLGLVLVANVAVAALATVSVVAWPYLAIPGGLLVAWLVACRLMVRSERRARRVVVRLPGGTPRPNPEVEDDGPLTEEIDAVPASEPVAGPPAVTVSVAGGESVQVGWDPVPVTLPTYVSKEPAARRSVRTIDLESTGVWTSGRSEIDSALARGAEETEKADKAAREAADAERRRATGS